MIRILSVSEASPQTCYAASRGSRMTTRREFIAGYAASLAWASRAWGQALPAAPTTRPNIGQIDHDRILRIAAVPTSPPTTAGEQADLTRFHAFCSSVPALAAATVIDRTNAERYAALAAPQLKAWFVNQETRLPSDPGDKPYQRLIDVAPLGEICVALPFLHLDEELVTAIKDWFASYLAYLTENRTALLARDAKDRNASSWLLQTTAAAKLTANEAILSDCRHRFKTSTIRAQINAEGLFPHELTSENPFRNSLFNLDLLGGACQLLSTQFENIWEHELQDGPGMRSAVAKHAYYIRDRAKWPYPADSVHFNLLPYRRPTLVFAGRAFGNAEYVTLWRGLNPDPTDLEMLETFPIRQPVLWMPNRVQAS